MRLTFLYFLFGKNKKPYYEASNGTILEADENYLKPDGQLARIKHAPDGWKGTLVKYARNIKYWGLVRSMAVSMRFSGDGFRILKYLMWTYGYEVFCLMGMMKLNSNVTGWGYEEWYAAEINFIKWKQTKVAVEVQALEGGMAKIFKAYETTVFEIPIDTDPEHVNVLQDGIVLTGRQNYVVPQYYFDPFLGNGSFGFYPLVVDTGAEGVAPGVIMQTQGYLHNDGSWTTDNFLCIAEETNIDPVPINIKGTIRLKLKILRDNTYFAISFVRSNINAPIPFERIYSYQNSLHTTQEQVIDIGIDVNFVLQPGDRVFMDCSIGQGTNTGRPCAWEFVDDSFLVLEFKNKFRETYAKGLYPETLFKRIVQKMIEGQYIPAPKEGDPLVFWESVWLPQLKNLVIMSGDSLRGIPGAVIKTSIAEFFQFVFRFGASLGVRDNRLYIEKFINAFNPTVIAHLGEVADATLSPAEDIMFNTIKAGGPEVEYNDINGKSEFTQWQFWKSPATRVPKELDLSHSYRVDPYGIEYTRINFEGKTTTDAAGDNDVFVEAVELTKYNNGSFDYYKLLRPAYTLIEGVADTVGIFNTTLSPKQAVLDNMGLINSVLDLMDGQNIVLANAVKNKDLKTVLAGVTLDQKEDIVIGTGTPKIFRPHYINFKTKVSVNLLPVINSNPHGLVDFTVKGRLYLGFIWDGGVKPALNDTLDWTVISAATNDLSKFYD